MVRLGCTEPTVSTDALECVQVQGSPSAALPRGSAAYPGSKKRFRTPTGLQAQTDARHEQRAARLANFVSLHDGLDAGQVVCMGVVAKEFANAHVCAAADAPPLPNCGHAKALAARAAAEDPPRIIPVIRHRCHDCRRASLPTEAQRLRRDKRMERQQVTAAPALPITHCARF
jgi:hypothetical protein